MTVFLAWFLAQLMVFRRKMHTKQLQRKIKHGSWHNLGAYSVLWLKSQRISTREMQSRTHMLTDPTRYNLAIWFMEYSMLSSSIHFHCTMFIVDWLNLALSLWKESRYVHLYFAIGADREAHKTTGVCDRQSTWHGKSPAAPALHCPWNGLPWVTAMLLRLCLFWVVLQRLFLVSAFWKATLHDCFEVHLVSVKTLSLYWW